MSIGSGVAVIAVCGLIAFMLWAFPWLVWLAIGGPLFIVFTALFIAALS